MLRIYGHSDDVVVIDGHLQDEVGPNRAIVIGDGRRGMRVTFRYSASRRSGAVWRGAIEQIDEGVPLFPVEVSEAAAGGQSYSVMFIIDCPDDTPVTCGKVDLRKRGGR